MAIPKEGEEQTLYLFLHGYKENQRHANEQEFGQSRIVPGLNSWPQRDAKLKLDVVITQQFCTTSLELFSYNELWNNKNKCVKGCRLRMNNRGAMKETNLGRSGLPLLVNGVIGLASDEERSFAEKKDRGLYSLTYLQFYSYKSTCHGHLIHEKIGPQNFSELEKFVLPRSQQLGGVFFDSFHRSRYRSLSRDPTICICDFRRSAQSLEPST